MQKTKRETAYIVGTILAVVAIIAVIAIGLHLRNQSSDAQALETSEPAASAAEGEDHGLVTEVHTISYEAIQDGLTDMGFLVTEEYYFTEVVTDSKLKKLLNTDLNIPFTESSYVASYDGVVNAGIDFSKIRVDTETAGSQTRITVTVPKAVIQTVDIDPDSFVLYSEKTGIGNPFSVEEYNESLKGLENSVERNAKENKILDRAEEHARQIIKVFVGSLLPEADYTLEIVVK